MKPPRLDLLAALSLALLSGVVAHRYVSERFVLSYDSAYRDATEDLLHPCVGHAGETIDQGALDASPEWQAFAANRSSSLDCAALRDLPRVSTGHLSDMQRYLHASLSALFDLNGPRRSVYASYMAGMVVLTVLAVYGVMRLAASPLIACAATLPFVLSDLHLQSVLHPAEYAKAPFFVACLWVCGSMVVRPLTRRALFAAAALAGVVVGVGIGFKTDVLICLPIAIVLIACFVPRTVGCAERLGLAAAFGAALTIAGWPVLKAQFGSGYGSLFPVQVLGGMNRNFADWYATPSLYDYGVRFDDTHVTYLINSYDQRVNGAIGFAEFYTRPLQHAATQLVIALDRAFPADFLLRWFAATVDVLKIHRSGLAAAAVATPLLLVAVPRLGLCLVFLLASAVGYVSIVFQTKHFFHLAWVPLWFVAFAIQQAAVFVTQSAVPRQPWRLRRGVWVIAAAGGALAIFFAARAFQQRRAVDTIAMLLHHTGTQLLDIKDESADGFERVRVNGLGTQHRTTPLVEDYLAVTIECGGSRDGVVTGVYDQPTSPREPMRVPCSQGHHWIVFWPIYQYPPTSRFRWFETESATALRIVSIKRFSDLHDVPLLLKFVVPDDFPRRRWYQSLRPRFLVEPLAVHSTT